MEQATLVRDTAEDVEGQDEVPAPERRETLMPLQAAPSDEDALGAACTSIEMNREDLELLAEIATGVTTEVVARNLDVSARTLRRRIRNICDLLGVQTPIEAVVWAARRQLI